MVRSSQGPLVLHSNGPIFIDGAFRKLDTHVMDDVEKLAIQLYEADCFMLGLYSTGEESWLHDREDVRERYRAKARELSDIIVSCKWSGE